MIEVVDREGHASTYDADEMATDRDGLYLTKKVNGQYRQVAVYNSAAWQSAALVASPSDPRVING